VNLCDSSIAQIKEYIKHLSNQRSMKISEQGERYEMLVNIVSYLKDDNQKASKSLIRFAERILKGYSHWQEMISNEEKFIESGYELIAGVDEVGRGPLAGPVVSASVILDRNICILGINDSKKLSETQRELLYSEIQKYAISIGVGIIDAEIIDKINILRASLDAMSQAVFALSIQPNLVLVDGQHCPNIALPTKSIIGGDGLSASIASASIIAKVTRDRIMDDFDKIYPQYGFSKNKGYPTPDHLSALRRFGPCKIHRKSFAPVSEVIQQTEITFNL
jgi:ribonuclease HII